MQSLLHDSKYGLTDRSIFRSACFLISVYIGLVNNSGMYTELKRHAELIPQNHMNGIYQFDNICPHNARFFGVWCSAGQIFIKGCLKLGNPVFQEKGKGFP